MALAGRLRWLLLVFCLLCGAVRAQDANLQPAQPVERDIAGGQSHTYQMQLTAGQFVRLRLDQQMINSALTVTAPDGKPAVEMDMVGAGEPESLSLEAAATGNYQVVVRGIGAEGLQGSYRLTATVQAMATAQDRQRLTAESLLIEARALSKQDDASQQVIDKSQQALNLWRELGEPAWIATALNLIGAAYDGSNQSDKAIEYYQQALDVCRANGLRAREAFTLASMAGSYSALDQIEKDTAYYEDALKIYRELRDQAEEGQALLSAGVEYMGLGEYEKALGVSEQALAIFRATKDRVKETRSLANMATYYGMLYRYDTEVEYLNQALAVNRLVNDQANQHQLIHNMGAVSDEQGDHEKAISYYEQALAISRELKDRQREEQTLGAMGDPYVALKQYDKAVAYYEQALMIARDLKNRWGEGHDLWKLSKAYTAAGQFDKAAAYGEQALAIARENASLIYQLYILADLANAENGRGNLTQARAYIEESLRAADLLRAQRDSFATRAEFFSFVQNNYQIYTGVLMRQHKAEPTKGFDVLAVETSERQRARGLLDLLTEARADVRQGVDPALIERENALVKQISEKAQTHTGTPEQAAKQKLEISQLETELEQAHAAIRRASPRYAALTQPQPLKLKEIQAQLDANTLLLEYSLGKDRSYLWAITRNSLTSYELPKEEQIKQSALQVYAMLTARSSSKRDETVRQRRERVTQAEAKLPAAAQSLSQMLLAPAAAEFGNKRLAIVADGALQYIPFAMLPDPVTGGRQSVAGSNQPLIVNHEVISLPSASVLAIQRSELADRRPAPKLLAVIADPVFDRADVRLKSLAPQADKEHQTPAVARNDARPSAQPVADNNGEPSAPLISYNDARSIEHLAEESADKSGKTRRLVIPRLPFTHQEATRLLALAPKDSSFGAVDFQANRATVLNGELSQYRYVHFATHGLLDSERPGLSSLVLSMVDAQGKPQDGFLRANDIYGMKLPAELVVLSACQTGLGKEIKGEGLVGLTRGFMYAGAARVVVSLWSVNDKATSDLMAKFYEKMLKEGEHPAAALRAAQVEMWRQKQWQSPYYWAAFTMQGEWR